MRCIYTTIHLMPTNDVENPQRCRCSNVYSLNYDHIFRHDSITDNKL